MIFAQHGHQRSTMIETGINAGSLSGVILSTQNEDRQDMDAYVNALRAQYGPGLSILVDPLFQAFTYAQPRLGRLPTYPYYPNQQVTLATLTVPANLVQLVGSTLDYQAALPVSRLLSPTVILDSFNGQWAPIVLSMLNQAITHRNTQGYQTPLLGSLVISEAAFSNTAGLNQFLNQLSAMDIHGFYLVVHRLSHEYPAVVTPNALENMMFFTHSLAELNGYEVVVGFADLIGLNLHAVGATATGTGWFFGCRQHTDRKFTTGRGRSPLARYTSAPLLTSVFVTELETAHTANFKVPLLSNTPYDQPFFVQAPNQVNWRRATSTLHHWAVLQSLSQAILAGATPTQRLDLWSAMITNARQLFTQARQAGVAFATLTGPRDLVSYTTGVAQFRATTGL